MTGPAPIEPRPAPSSTLFATPEAGAESRIRRFRTRVRVRGEASHEAASVLEHTLEPGCIAMPVHRHPGITEVLHVLDGILVVRLGADERTAPAGTSVVVPPGAWHTFWVASDAPAAARVLAVVAPGGMERYYEEVAAQLRADDRPDMPGVRAASERHGIDVDMTSLWDLVERHGLELA